MGCPLDYSMLGYTILTLSGVTDRVKQIWLMCHSFMRHHPSNLLIIYTQKLYFEGGMTDLLK
jgi:hypothetical protein